MASANLGRVGFVNKGAWVDGLHKINDIVSYNNVIYACILGHTSTAGDIIPTNPTYWEKWTGSTAAGIANTPAGNIAATNVQAAINELDTEKQPLAPNYTGIKSTNIASGATVNIGAATGDYIHITGSVTITAFDNVAAGITRTIIFDGSLTITHNPATLILPNGENIVTVAGDSARFVSEGGGNWKCVSYQSSIRFAMPQNFRLSLTTGVPVTTSDVLAATTLYLTPYNGDKISLYNGLAWETLKSAEMSIAIPATTSQMYDVFVYNNAGVATLELTAWTNDTTRATALVRQDGILVKSGALTRRYVGSFRTTTVSGQTEDSQTKRYVWNYYNRVRRLMLRQETTASWTYTTAAFRQVNANAANQLDFVIGYQEDTVKANANGSVNNSTTAGLMMVGIGLDSTTVNSAVTLTNGSTFASTTAGSPTALYEAIVPIGRHYLAWLEYSTAAGTSTWGTNNFPVCIKGELLG